MGHIPGKGKKWIVQVISYTKDDVEVETFGAYDATRTYRKLMTVLRELGNEDAEDMVTQGFDPDSDEDDGFRYDDVGLAVIAQAIPF